ncbi:TPA: acyltransferase [Burkholderia vietnamiensis]|uniref:acyltransferase family protein n=1 Tax=Burkholderia vietnamiensis TaxID=60552 RepID=UPI00264CC3D4|nr:acyltransferase [Burkholderia vietnamiensis]MDN8111236.1 acyltransferase [Burkholderia vietnamiensis]HDR9135992.1 acyltransferase [Burkholderia vietnamiensis]
MPPDYLHNDFRKMSIRGDIPALTGLRFIAAASVVAFHAPLFGILPQNWYGKFQMMQGVSFFFVLSGFILQYNYRDTISRIGFLRFISLRIAKIWPIHLAALALYFVLIAGSLTFWWHAMSPWSFAAVFVLLQSWIPNPEVYFAMNGSSWTLSVELFFYALFPLLCPIVRRSPGWTGVTSIAVVVTYALILNHAAATSIDATGFYSVLPISRIAEFVVGAAVAEIRFSRRSPSLSSATATIIEVALLALVAAWNYLIGYSLDNASESVGIALATLWKHAGSMPVFALLLYFYSYNKGKLSRILASKPLVFLGQTSFALYIVQLPVMRFIGEHFSHGRIIAITAASLFVVSTAAHLIVEMPIYRVAKRALSKRPHPYSGNDQMSGLRNVDPS